VIAGVKPGRTRDDQITIFGTVGLAFQDLPAAWQVYLKARALGIGTSVDF
jgi:ornithine cyclodeaminase/alanine dehydrogenase-like protein (mu-crystallin family)